jgi:hypothetical protein
MLRQETLGEDHIREEDTMALVLTITEYFKLQINLGRNKKRRGSQIKCRKSNISVAQQCSSPEG